MDMKTGENELILSLAWAAANRPDERFGVGRTTGSTTSSSTPPATASSSSTAGRSPPAGWYTRMYTARPDGSDPRLIQDTGMVSHFDWRDDRTLLAWSTTPEHGDAFYLFDIETGAVTPIGTDVLTRDGHCSYSPDRRWILNDTYPDADRMQTLMLFRPEDGTQDRRRPVLPRPEADRPGPVRPPPPLEPRRDEGLHRLGSSGHEAATLCGGRGVDHRRLRPPRRISDRSTAALWIAGRQCLR